jgi:hypothetical protein
MSRILICCESARAASSRIHNTNNSIPVYVQEPWLTYIHVKQIDIFLVLLPRQACLCSQRHDSCIYMTHVYIHNTNWYMRAPQPLPRAAAQTSPPLTSIPIDSQYTYIQPIRVGIRIWKLKLAVWRLPAQVSLQMVPRKETWDGTLQTFNFQIRNPSYELNQIQ